MGSGGGLGDEVGSSLTLSDSTVSGNQAGGLGGGLSNAGTASLTNATIAGNTGVSAGGVLNTGTLTVVNGTIAENHIASGGTGGGLYSQFGTATLYNTIVASNTAGASNKASDAAGSLALTSANNLFGTGGSAGLSTFNSNQINVATPDLGPLANNGGPTETIALLTGSLAIDHGSNAIPGVSVPTTDQRGALRGPAGVDAGAEPSTSVPTRRAPRISSPRRPTRPIWEPFARAFLAGPTSAPTTILRSLAGALQPRIAPNTIVFQTTGASRVPRRSPSRRVSAPSSCRTPPRRRRSTAQPRTG